MLQKVCNLNLDGDTVIKWTFFFPSNHSLNHSYTQPRSTLSYSSERRETAGWVSKLVLVAQSCLTLCDPIDPIDQASLSMRFSRLGYWSGLPFPSPGDLPNPGIKPGSPALQADSLPTELQGKQKCKRGITGLNWLDWKWKWSHSVMSDSLWPHGLQSTTLLHPWDFPGKSTVVGCHCLLQGIFLTQGSNLALPHCRQTLYWLSHQVGLQGKVVVKDGVWNQIHLDLNANCDLTNLILPFYVPL